MKKEARAQIEAKMREEQTLIRYKLVANRHIMRKLVEEQTILKRKMGEYYRLIRSLK